MQIRRNFAIYLKLLSVTIRSQLQYRVSFLLDFLSTATITITEFAALAFVINRFDGIQGWSLYEVAFLYGLVEISFGLMDMIFSGFDPPNFGRMVRQGTFDQLLLRPVNVTMQVLASDFALRRLGKILLGIAIFAMAIDQLNITWTLAKLLYLPVVVASMTMFFGGLFIIGSTITFWTVNSIQMMNILTYGGSYLISHPMHIFGAGLRRFFTYVVPAIFLNFFPALFFLDKADPLNFPPFARFLSPVVGLGILGASLLFWRFGQKHYQSTGT